MRPVRAPSATHFRSEIVPTECDATRYSRLADECSTTAGWLDRVARLHSAPHTVYELAWLALGCIVALLATRLRAQHGTEVAAAIPQPNQVVPAVVAAVVPEVVPAAAATVPTTELQTTISPESHEMALSMASELANLVSAVEGSAHYLIEAAPARTQLPIAAEAMLASIARLRGLHTKLVAFGRGRAIVSGTTDVNELITSLRDELQEMQLGLELRWEPPEYLPRIQACPATMRDALLFVCSALLQAERGATRLTFTVERSFASDEPAIIIELHLEWVNAADSRKRDSVSHQAFALDFEAAKHLIESHRGKLTLSHTPSKTVHALVMLPLAVPADSQAPIAASPTSSDRSASEPALPHSYGGALVLESDPALRAVLARELKASGRAVFACADGASAHTFLQATPDRFELLIVDDAHQLD